MGVEHPPDSLLEHEDDTEAIPERLTAAGSPVGFQNRPSSLTILERMKMPNVVSLGVEEIPVSLDHVEEGPTALDPLIFAGAHGDEVV